MGGYPPLHPSTHQGPVYYCGQPAPLVVITILWPAPPLALSHWLALKGPRLLLVFMFYKNFIKIYSVLSRTSRRSPPQGEFAGVGFFTCPALKLPYPVAQKGRGGIPWAHCLLLPALIQCLPGTQWALKKCVE